MFGKKKPNPQAQKPSVNSGLPAKKQTTQTPKKASQQLFNQAQEFLNTRATDLEKSTKRAWIVATAACVIAALAVISNMLLLPLKTVEPYVIRYDKSTGETDIVSVLETVESTEREEVAKFFASRYVNLVEGYDWYTVSTDFNQALMFSSSDIGNRLKNKMNGANASYKIYGDQSRVTIDISSVSMIDEDLLQVRFVKTVVPYDGGNMSSTGAITPAPVVSNMIATIGYDYINVPEIDDVRRINPLGFVVMTYKTDMVS